jgi:endonuclease YncB( thermonuclease family)
VAVGGLATQYAIKNDAWNSLSFDSLKSNSLASAVASIGQPFGLCSVGYQANCVIDGDTISFDGQRVRMVDYDTPEIGEPKCASESALGHKAKLRLLEILNSGPVTVVKVGTRDSDVYGRKLRRVEISGQSVGTTLIAEGLAWPWEGRRHNWC